MMADRARTLRLRSASSPHALPPPANDNRFGIVPSSYDADGNMTSDAGRSITYTSFNMTAQVTQGASTTALAYDPDHQRIRMDNGASFTFYLNDAASGAMTERVNASGTITWKSYLMADGRIVAIRSTTSGVTTMRYVVTDHLNSVAVILDEKAAVIAGGRQSFDAWGLQRNADGTPDSTPCNLTQSSASTRGYTGQEEMASVCLINYNARIYDPQLGRFLSADPTTEAPDDGQDWNRYSYVLNNPLAFTDPSGNSFLTDLFAAIVSVAIIVLAPELIGPWATFADFMDAAASFNLSAIAVAAGSGAVAGAISAGITGGSVLKGALFGGISGALFAAVGAPLGRALSAADMLGNPVVGNFIAQGFVGGLNSTIEGGNFGSGFLAGGVGSLAGSWSGGQFDPGHMLASAIVGGAASVLGGGKFANGAITGAFAYAAGSWGQEAANDNGVATNDNAPASDTSPSSQPTASSSGSYDPLAAMDNGGVETVVVTGQRDSLNMGGYIQIAANIGAANDNYPRQRVSTADR